MKKILLLAGARPNYMKIFPIWRALCESDAFDVKVIHTGQHYDPIMSDIIFTELGMPKPDFCLGVGSGTHGQQTGQALERIEEVLLKEKPDLLVVVGDINSTLAGALAAAKLGIKIAHVEAGLRSFDRTMPEEINRVMTDAICEILLTPSDDGNENLLKEGISASRIHLVGNLMIDSLIQMLPKCLERPKVMEGAYVAVTLHRPSNVDNPKSLRHLLTALNTVSQDLPVFFPMHPRTRKMMDQLSPGIELTSQFHIQEPMGYLDFLNLTANAAAVITDSGGIQEETTFLGIPCLTLRPNTERPITLTLGTNRLVDPQTNSLEQELHAAIQAKPKKPPTIPCWDGKAAQRTVEVFNQALQ